MKYTPRELEGNVNVSATHPLAELAWLLGGLVLLVAVIAISLAYATELTVSRIPVEAEVWLGERAVQGFEAEEHPGLQRRLDELLDALPADSPLHQYRFRAHLVASDQVNAAALPGGHVLVFSGLLKEVRSENELAMVLAHELGHYAHRHHLRGLGRGLGITFAALVLFGQESSVTEVVTSAFMTFEARYSRQQESDADAFGLELLSARYGHAGGATDFFSRLTGKAGGRLPYLLASHPHPADRIDALRRRIAGGGYPVGEVLPLGEDLKAGE